jgi:hypothetical protein
MSSLLFEGRGRPGLVDVVDEDWEVARRDESVDVNTRLVEEDISLFLGLALLWWGKSEAFDAILTIGREKGFGG